jgi:hypothetical protein
MQIAIGMPPAVIRRSQLVQVLLPYATGVVLATGLGLLASRAYERAGGFQLTVPAGGVAVTAGLAVMGAGLVALSCLPALGARLRPELLRRE